MVSIHMQIFSYLYIWSDIYSMEEKLYKFTPVVEIKQFSPGQQLSPGPGQSSGYLSAPG